MSCASGFVLLDRSVLLGGTATMTGLIWTFVGMYVVGALLTLVLKSSADPGQKGHVAEEAPEAAPTTA